MTFLGTNFHFHDPKFLMTVFLFSHRPCFPDFSYLFSAFHIFTVCNVIYDPIFTRQKPLFQKINLFLTLFMLSRTSDKHYFSKYWGVGCTPPQISGGGAPQSPLGIRP